MSRKFIVLRVSAGMLFAAILLPRVGAAADYQFQLQDWPHDTRGHLVTGGEALDFQDDLNIGRRNDPRFVFTMSRHRGGPELQVSYSAVDGKGSDTVDRDIVFGPLVLHAGTSHVETKGSFQDYDATLRWSFRSSDSDRYVAFAPGLTLKRVQGDVTVTDTTAGTHDRSNYGIFFPELHAAVEWRPFSRLRLASEVQGLAYQGSSAEEWRIGAGFAPLRSLWLTAGYQDKRYKVSGSGDDLHARLTGALFGLAYELR